MTVISVGLMLPTNVISANSLARSFDKLPTPTKAITESELMTARIPKEADRRRSEATLDCSYDAK